MKRYQNISLLQLNVKTGQKEYYLPKNASWRDKVIEKIVVFAPEVNTTPVVSPVNGATVFNEYELSDMFFDLYNEDGVNIVHNLQAYSQNLNNTYPLTIGQKLSFDLCRIHFTSAPVKDGALMLYVFYNSTDLDVDEPTENITINFPLQAGEKLSLQQVIERYMYARNKRVRHIAVWNGNTTSKAFNSAFITLRDTDGYLCHEYLPTFMLRPSILPTGPYNILMPENRIVLNADIDFNNSFIVNTQSQQDDYIVTFYY